MNPKKKPKFLRSSSSAYVRLGEKWRRPRGIHSKLKLKQLGKGFIPSPGYGAPRALKFKHPSGLLETLVSNQNDLLKMNPKTHAARISASVGNKKKFEILKKAEELKLRVLNPPKMKRKLEKLKTEKNKEAK